MKSSAQTAGSKVVVKLGCGQHSLTVESTPDFYIRKQSPIVYLTIGEVEFLCMLNVVKEFSSAPVTVNL